MTQQDHSQDEHPEEESRPYESYVDLPEHVRNTFNAILKKYEPAALNEPSERKTTREIYSEISSHCGIVFPFELVSAFLTEHNFISTQGSDFEFFWLMKLKR